MKCDFINAHTHRPISKCIELVQNDPFHPIETVYYSIGIHPQDVGRASIEVRKLISNWAEKTNCLAIGEIGLDCRLPDSELQEALFIDQLKIAQLVNKPIILHCVGQWERCKYLHQKYAPYQLLVYHGFNKPAILEKVLDYPPAILSLGPGIFKNQKLQDKLTNIANNRLLIETDDSSIDITEVYKEIARLKCLTLSDLKIQIFENFKHIFQR